MADWTPMSESELIDMEVRQHRMHAGVFLPRLVAEIRRYREALREAREDTARLEHAMLRMMIITDCGPQTVRVYDTRGAIDQHRSIAEAEPRG